MDPLSTLVATYGGNAATKILPVRKGDDFEFSDGSIFPGKMETAFREKSGTSYYTLASLVFFLEHVDVPLASYIRMCLKEKKNGIKAVSTVDKKDVLGFVEGTLKSTPKVDQSKLGASIDSNDEKQKKRISSSSKSSAKKRSRADLEDGEVASTSENALPEINRILNAELSFRDRNAVLNAPKSLADVLGLYKDSKPTTKPGEVKTSTHNSNQAEINQKKNLIVGLPLVVVPSAVTSVLTLHNASRFLGDGVFVGVDAARKAAPHVSATARRSLIVKHALSDGSACALELVDSCDEFTDKDWRRLAGVVVQGKEWQFKTWKWTDPAILFDKVCGVYLHWEDVRVPKNVRGWNVTSFSLKKQQRHLDSVQSHRIWEHLCAFMKEKRPELLAASKKNRAVDDEP